jgi:SpoVK/Ycf46/Vps4 family AAA+-type ATPase
MEDEDDADGDAGDEDEADGDLEADMDAFDDMDEDEDSDADDDDDMEGESWLGKRSDITKSRKTRFGPLAGLGAGGYFGDSLHSKLHHEERDSQERANVEALFELVTAEENVPCILYLKDTEKTLLTSYERYTHFKRQLDKISTPLVVIGSSIVSTKGKGDKAPGGGFLLSKSGGQTTLLDFALFDHISRMEERARDTSKGARILSRLLPNKIAVNPPKDGPELPKWTKQITKDQQDMKQQQNRAAIRKILEKNNIAIIEGEEGLRSRPLREQVFTSDKVEKIVGWAVGHYLINSDKKGQEVKMDGTKLMIPATAIDHGIRMLNRLQPLDTKTSLKDVQTDNDFERKLLAEAIPPNELAVRFEDIGALDKVKNTLKELVMLPLQRPELFRKGNLTKPCKGILLFGPPGTGKTMLAKAVATESGANFINCSMSSIGSKWFGEGEKYARAVFTLASKISPCVVFIDEVDSILGSREKSGEHEAMRKIKNEFMSMWDGLKTKENERVIVMAATNRPFDLDDAVLRRMPRRLLVDLPDADNRQKILRVILAKEDLESDFDFKAVGDMTEGFSGSDLKNLCISAAYMPIREIIEKEKKEGKEMDLSKTKKSKKADKGKEKADDAMVQEDEEDEDEEEDPEEREPPEIRALGMEDFVKAKKENSASVHEDARAVGELRKWNEMYGEGGNARGKDLSYFL